MFGFASRPCLIKGVKTGTSSSLALDHIKQDKYSDTFTSLNCFYESQDPLV